MLKQFQTLTHPGKRLGAAIREKRAHKETHGSYVFTLTRIYIQNIFFVKKACFRTKFLNLCISNHKKQMSKNSNWIWAKDKARLLVLRTSGCRLLKLLRLFGTTFALHINT